jgi:hypothetical protein
MNGNEQNDRSTRLSWDDSCVRDRVDPGVFIQNPELPIVRELQADPLFDSTAWFPMTEALAGCKMPCKTPMRQARL